MIEKITFGTLQVKIVIGGVIVQVMIDSGAVANMITKATFEELKRGKSQLDEIEVDKNVQFVGYGIEGPAKIIPIETAFRAWVEAGSESSEETFRVAEFGQENLLSKETATKLKLLRVGYQVQTLVATVGKLFPKVPNFTVRFTIDESVKPIRQPYRTIPLALEDLVDRKLDELLAQGIIEPCPNPSWVSNLVPIMKDHNSIRTCVDMRRVNEAIITENFPMPNVEIMLATLPRNARLSKIDLVNAYFHMELEHDCRYITAFITKKGVFQFTRLTMGIKSAPEIFGRSMGLLLAGLKGIAIYLDDILVFGATKTEHNDNLQVSFVEKKRRNSK